MMMMMMIRSRILLSQIRYAQKDGKKTSNEEKNEMEKNIRLIDNIRKLNSKDNLNRLPLTVSNDFSPYLHPPLGLCVGRVHIT